MPVLQLPFSFLHSCSLHDHVTCLNFADAPSINIPSPTFTATLGQTFVLSCPAEGQPTPTIQWTPPDGLNPNSYRMEANGDLTVFSAVAQSMGPYTCMATNSVGSMSSQIEVVVRGRCNAI